MQRINLRVLYALSRHIASDDDRFELGAIKQQVQCVRLEAMPGRGVTLIGTDGKVLVAFNDPHVEVVQPLMLNVAHKLARFFKLSTKGEFDDADAAYGLLAKGADGHWSLGYKGKRSTVTSACSDLAGQDYPNWRRLMPREIPHPQAVTFNPELMARIDAFKIELRLRHNPLVIPGNTDDGPALVDFYDDRFAGCIMPLKTKAFGTTVFRPPEWATV